MRATFSFVECTKLRVNNAGATMPRVTEKRLTGRQLWERGLVGKGEDVIDEEDGLVDHK